MLNRFNQGLLAVLVVQLVLVVLVQGRVLWASSSPESEALLSLTREELSELRIDDHTGDIERSLVMTRGDEGWWLSRDGARYPVSDATLDSVLTPLTEARLTWPVADSDAAAERFETTTENFQRRIALASASGEEHTLYFGTSPAFRKVHVRQGIEPEIYALDLNAVDLNAKAEHWLDRTLLRVDSDSLDTVNLANRTVTKEGDDWRLADTTDGSLNQAAWQDWLRRWSTLTVTGWVDEDKIDSLAEAEPALSATFEGNNIVQLALYEMDGSYALKRNDLPGYFRVPSGTAEALAATDTLWEAAKEE